MVRAPRWHATALAMGAGIAALAAPTAAQERPYDGVTLRIAGLHNAPFENMKPFIEAFEEEPGAEIQLEQMSNDNLFQKATVESAAQTGYFDILRLSPNFLPTFVEPGWIVPLDDVVADSGIALDDFIPAAVEALGQVPGDDRIWALPLVANTGMMSYRTDLFGDPEEQAAFEAAYGYPLRPPETTEEWLDAAEFFTRDTDGDGENDLFGFGVGQKAGGAAFIWALTPVWTFGGEVMDEASMRVLLDSPATVAGLEWAKELQNFQPPASLAWAIYDNVGPMQDGRLAMSIQLFSFVEDLLDPEKSAYADRIAYKILPVHPDNGRGYETGKFVFGGGGLAIHTHSRNKEAAAAFLSWFLDEEQARDYALAGTLTPRRSVLEDKTILESKPVFKATLPVFLESLDKVAKARPKLAESNAVLMHLSQAWHEIALDQKTAEEAVADAHREMIRLLDNAGYDVASD